MRGESLAIELQSLHFFGSTDSVSRFPTTTFSGESSNVAVQLDF